MRLIKGFDKVPSAEPFGRDHRRFAGFAELLHVVRSDVPVLHHKDAILTPFAIRREADRTDYSLHLVGVQPCRKRLVVRTTGVSVVR